MDEAVDQTASGAPDGPAAGAEATLRVTSNPTVAGDWALVLASAAIAHRLHESDGGFRVIVAAADARAAAQALAAFDAESMPGEAPPAPDLGPSALGVAFALVLLAMFAVAGARDGSSPSAWFSAGSASAELILHGQWWRAITALTLHADLLHLAGNVVACLLFVSAVGRWLGPGLGATLILASASVANGLTAVAHRTAHVSVGASTATFAALGLVAGLQLVRRWRHAVRRRYAWLPLGAGLGLFAMLGVGEHADVLAHLFGLGVGALAGAIVAGAGVRAPRAAGQALLILVASVVLVGAWVLAFRAMGRPLW
jgi:rhomboid protease GluP